MFGLAHLARQFIGLGSFQPFLWLDPQVQFQLAVDAIDPFMVPSEAFHVAQIQKTQAKTPRPPIGRQTDKPIGNLRILITELAFVSIAGLTDLERTASQRDADPVLGHSFLGHLFALRRP